MSVSDIGLLASLAGPRASVSGILDLFRAPLALVVLSAALVAWMRAKTQLRQFRILVPLAALGIAARVFLDAASSWGIAPFVPFSPEHMSLDWFPSVDPVLWVLAASALTVWVVKPRWGVPACRIALVALALYCVLQSAGHSLAVERFHNSLETIKVIPDRIEAFPQPIRPLAWNVVAFTPDRYYQGFVSPISGTRGRVRAYFRPELPDKLKDTAADSYFRWARAPMVKFIAGRYPFEAAIYDLRFLNPMGNTAFVLHLKASPSAGPEVRWLKWDMRIPDADMEFELPR